MATASLVPERLAGGYVPDESRPSQALAEARLEKWRQVVAGGDRRRFERRLACDGLSLGAVRRVLGTVHLGHGQALPAWADTLRQALSVEATGPAGRTTDAFLPLPFEDILQPFVHVARQQLLNRPGAHYARLPEVGRAALECHLVRTLSHTGAPTFLHAFAVFRALKQRRPCLGPPEPPADTTYYAAFVRDMLGGGLWACFLDYPVLARLLATQTDFWVEATGEFLQRLQADWPWMADHVSAITPGLSDPHHNGRSVMAVEFDTGLKLIYKPHDLGLEAAYQACIAWLNAHGITPPLRPLRVVNRATHGWVEFAERGPCRSQAEAGLFYQRAGMLLALLYVLGGADYHYENLVAAGDQPVLVDHEMLLCPDLDSHAENVRGAATRLAEAIEPLVHRQLTRSVLGIGLLPAWELAPDGQAYDVSGLGHAWETARPIRQPVWKHINTDDMTRVYEPVSADASQQHNAPTWNGAALALEDYVDDFVAGFRRAYRFLADRQQAFFGPDGPLAAFKDQPVRLAFRKTRLYRALLERVLASRHLHDGADLSIQLDVLSRPLLTSDGPHPLWAVLSAEQAALAQLDIPRFVVQAGDGALCLKSGSTIAARVPAPGYAFTSSHVPSLSESDLERQSSFIRATCVGRTAGEKHVDGDGPGRLASEFDRTPLTPLELEQAALALAAASAEHAIRSDGEANWLHLEYDPSIGRHQLAPLGYDLYGGLCGVALFLAALVRVTGETHYKPLAMAALQPVRRALATASPEIQPPRSSLGGASGLGSIIYSLVRIGQFLNEDSLLQDARRAASLLTPDRIAGDYALDIVAGAAGAGLGLLALYEAWADPAVLRQAVACGERLCQARLASDTGYRAWPTLDGKLLTGFSHGAAGIAYALLRLYAATGEAAFCDAAEEGFAYEHSRLVPKVGNWPDLRTPAGQGASFMTGWCHGAPGIGLARLGGLAALDTPEIRADIAIALETTRQRGVQGLDHVCCGSLGRVEFLLAAASRLACAEWLEMARQWTGQLVRRARQAGGYALPLPPGQPPRFAPGFFQGSAGIGYELLRVATAGRGRLPCVLLWE